jgi:hypothetical protein
MEEYTREEALSIAIKQLGEQYTGQLDISDILPDDPIYKATKDFKDCWVIAVPQIPTSPLIVGAGRYLIISKFTGKILFDGMAGE